MSSFWSYLWLVLHILLSGCILLGIYTYAEFKAKRHLLIPIALIFLGCSLYTGFLSPAYYLFFASVTMGFAFYLLSLLEYKINEDIKLNPWQTLLCLLLVSVFWHEFVCLILMTYVMDQKIED